MSNKIQLKILDKRIQSIPEYSTAGSAGMDLLACISSNLILKPGECKLIETGISIFIENPSYAGLILPRSGLGHKKGLILGNSVGLIDSDYQGQLMVSCFNRSKESITIEPMMRFAQLVIVPVIQAKFELVDEFNQLSQRAEGGFGHTGV